MSKPKKFEEIDPGKQENILSEFLQFLRFNKKYWLLPIVIALLAFGVLIVLGGGSSVAPFIYSLF